MTDVQTSRAIPADVIPPEQLDAAEMMKMATTREVFTVVQVVWRPVESVEDQDGIWDYTIIRPNNRYYEFSLWPNPRRDTLATWLMQACQDGPVPGLVLVNGGTDKKLYYYLTAA